MKRPIFVVGYQRSGTTLLHSMLGAHSRIAAPPETWFITRVADHADYFGDLADDANLERALHETLHPVVPLFEGCGFDEPTLLARACSGERTYAALLDTIMSDFAERHGKVRWCEKTPTQSAASIVALFPDAQLVHIVRDPRDVVASSVHTPWTGLTARQLAVSWRHFTVDNIRIGAELGPERFVQVRYEDLARQPEATLRLVFGFLGEELEAEILTEPERRRATIAGPAAPWHGTVLERRPPPEDGAWRSRLRRDQRARAAAVVAPLLPPLGYPSPRPGTVIAGHALNVVLSPAELPHALARLRIRATARTPERRYLAMQRFVRERAETVTGATGG